MSEKPSWNPWELFRETPEELRLIEKRKVLRTAARAEWVKKKTSPYIPSTGFIFDPALQRFAAMKCTRFDHFKVDKKSTISLFVLLIMPVSILMFGFHRYRVDYINGVDSGKYSTMSSQYGNIWG